MPVKITTALMCLFNPAGYLMIDFTQAVLAQVVMMSIFVFPGYLLLLKYYQGRNWARWLVIFGSVVAVLNVWFLWAWKDMSSISYKLVVLLEIPLGVYLLYWLNSADAKRYFVRA